MNFLILITYNNLFGMLSSQPLCRFKSYKPYFSISRLQNFISPSNDKQNNSSSSNGQTYKFYFKKQQQRVDKIQIQKINQTSKKSQKYSNQMKILIRQSVSQMISYIQVKSLSFQCFLGAVTIFYNLIEKKQIPNNQATSYILASILISLKLFEVKQVSIAELAELTGDLQKKKQIFEAQSIISSTLNFQVYKQFSLLDQIYKLDETFDSQIKQKLFMLIQLCLLNGGQILYQQSFIRKIKSIIQGKQTSEEKQQLKEYFNEIVRTQQYRSIVFKWSTLVEADELIDKLQY